MIFNFNTRTFSLVALVAAFITPNVQAHGVVESITIGGQSHSAPGPIRQVEGNGPAATTNNIGSTDLTCGKGAKPVQETVSAKAGDTVDIQWSKTWMHKIGPVVTYMGKCNGACSSDDGTNIKFFKIDEKGLQNGNWPGQENIANGNPDSVTIPNNIEDGEYLIRHEIMNLSSIPQELYPSCIQVKVSGGSGTNPSDTISFPPGYSDSDVKNSIKVNNVYSMKSGYTPPGPKIATSPSKRDMMSRRVFAGLD